MQREIYGIDEDKNNSNNISLISPNQLIKLVDSPLISLEFESSTIITEEDIMVIEHVF